ncbi:TIGR04104 family putative zinc finger protein [Alkalicoccus daliensis]|uniref:Cxxc_20_cxxc protein n=1 Tax=Alkalicoccus daliensis TaxID=745820 RepID=A0A1H0CVN8_9BACI|nr:TIGR04104 family putative zinc finger protein [Alkalicoccus daliensis]SDN61993.1 cxxc_20_cxxc protein [Alkalicoccus daliensis]
MAKCDKCGNQFSWKEIFKKNFNYGEVTCATCGNNSAITFPSRFILTGVTIVPLLFFTITMEFFAAGWTNILFGLPAAAAGVCIAPFLVNYKLAD